MYIYIYDLQETDGWKFYSCLTYDSCISKSHQSQTDQSLFMGPGLDKLPQYMHY